jgi:hypothetical protein
MWGFKEDAVNERADHLNALLIAPIFYGHLRN